MDTFGARSSLRVGDLDYEIYSLEALERAGFPMGRLPVSLRILLENLLRHEDGISYEREDIEALARWAPGREPVEEIAFMPARVLLQDFTGVPAVVDLAAMRDAMAALGGDPNRINPIQPVELVIDHSIQVDHFGTADAFRKNEELDYQRNRERYAFLKWGQKAFRNFDVVPPNVGICHQVNLEYLARVVFSTDGKDGPARAWPDTLVGTDSHTPMVNGLGVLGWGVGGIEAEAAMLGQPLSMLIPQVVGFRLEGQLPEGTTATDLVLTVTEMLRKKGVVGKFVEFFGPGMASLAVADRATIANMCPEYGATCALFPVDAKTLEYLRFTGRSPQRLALVEAYTKAQGLFRGDDTPDPEFSDVVKLDLSTVEPSVAGPRRPQDRVRLGRAGAEFKTVLPSLLPLGAQDGAAPKVPVAMDGQEAELTHGSVVIAAITSCTNTSNPGVMIAAGLLAKKAVEKGLARKPWVKTSLAPGSRVVEDYFEASGLQPYLDRLGFNIVGFGCTTCIGNSGPLPPEVSDAIQKGGLVAASVLSGNRNFEGRINAEVRANYLMSPPLVVAFSLVGRIDVDLENEPLGVGKDGQPVYLRDIWPSSEEVHRTIGQALQSEAFRARYAHATEGDERWRALAVPEGDRYAWEPDSTYVRRPPYFEGMGRDAPKDVKPLVGARVLAVLGDSVTTDHISPAGNIKPKAVAGAMLVGHGVKPDDLNTYGARRGNHEVMVRGTFANVRIRNAMVPGVEGGFTKHLPSGDVVSIYDAAVRYRAEGVPLVILAGKEYGSGSSRDWAAKGPYLQGVRAVIAESYERIHRSNLVGMGILPLQFCPGESVASLGLTGEEVLDVEGLEQVFADNLRSGREVRVRARRPDGSDVTFVATIRIDTPQEVLYHRHGGILQYVVRQLLDGKEQAEAISKSVSTGAIHEGKTRPGEATVQEGSEESFPASDPPAY